MYPVILDMLADGRIHLAGISVLKKHLTDDNDEDVLTSATHKTKDEIEVLVAGFSAEARCSAEDSETAAEETREQSSGNVRRTVPRHSCQERTAAEPGTAKASSLGP